MFRARAGAARRCTLRPCLPATISRCIVFVLSRVVPMRSPARRKRCRFTHHCFLLPDRRRYRYGWRRVRPAAIPARSEGASHLSRSCASGLSGTDRRGVEVNRACASPRPRRYGRRRRWHSLPPAGSWATMPSRNARAIFQSRDLTLLLHFLMAGHVGRWRGDLFHASVGFGTQSVAMPHQPMKPWHRRTTGAKPSSILVIVRRSSRPTHRLSSVRLPFVSCARFSSIAAPAIRSGGTSGWSTAPHAMASLGVPRATYVLSSSALVARCSCTTHRQAFRRRASRLASR